MSLEGEVSEKSARVKTREKLAAGKSGNTRIRTARASQTKYCLLGETSEKEHRVSTRENLALGEQVELV